MKKSIEPIETLVIRLLQSGPIKSTNLIDRVAAIRADTTKQGVYRVIRKLSGQEHIVVHGKAISLNLPWIKTMERFFTVAEFSYAPNHTNGSGFLGVQEGDRIAYYFKSLKTLDAFWGHAFYLFSKLPGSEPIYVYNPNEWFAYARQVAEDTLLQIVREKEKLVLVAIGHDNYLNRELRKKFRTDLVQYAITPSVRFQKPNYYFNIFGDLLIEVWLDPTIARQIDHLFHVTPKFTDAIQAQFIQIISMRGKNKLVISRNIHRAEKYKKKLAKYFYIPKIKGQTKL